MSTVSISIATIESLAPDQASLDSAKKLLKPAKWSGHGKDGELIWAQCQGSGSTPYYTVADLDTHGYKCTCPSRKFPCKHALALMTLFVQDASPFTDSPLPDWVNDWLSRRKTPRAKKDADATTPAKSLTLDDTVPEPQEQLSPEELAKKQAQKAKQQQKQQEKQHAITCQAITEWQGWANDQLRLGLSTFLNNPATLCRQIAARMSDAKLTNFASRLDKLPATLASTPKQYEQTYLLGELGKLVLLTQSYLADPDDPDTRRALLSTENKDKVLESSPQTHLGIWQIISETFTTRKDGLIAQSRYLVRLSPADTQSDCPPFALLLDYHHRTAVPARTQSQVGNLMVGELVFYKSRVPLRAFFVSQETLDNQGIFALNDTLPTLTLQHPAHPQTLSYPPPQNPKHAFARLLGQVAWLEHFPIAVGAGQVAKDDKGEYWYVGDNEYYPLKNKDLPLVVLGSRCRLAFMLYDGNYGELLGVISDDWGFLACQ